MSIAMLVVRIVVPLLLLGVLVWSAPSLPWFIVTGSLVPLALWFFGVYTLLWFVLPEGMMWLRFCRAKCPRCGERRWSRGFYEGWQW